VPDLLFIRIISFCVKSLLLNARQSEKAISQRERGAIKSALGARNETKLLLSSWVSCKAQMRAGQINTKSGCARNILTLICFLRQRNIKSGRQRTHQQNFLCALLYFLFAADKCQLLSPVPYSSISLDKRFINKKFTAHARAKPNWLLVCQPNNRKLQERLHFCAAPRGCAVGLETGKNNYFPYLYFLSLEQIGLFLLRHSISLFANIYIFDYNRCFMYFLAYVSAESNLISQYYKANFCQF
jgi:hypothetical protein